MTNEHPEHPEHPERPEHPEHPELRVFRLHNRASHGWWVIAASLEEAVQISIGWGRLRSAEGLTRHSDQTEQLLTGPGARNLAKVLANLHQPAHLVLSLAQGVHWCTRPGPCAPGCPGV